MKKTICVILALGCVVTFNAQNHNEDLKTQIGAAQKAVTEKNFREANFQLQQAMNSLAMVIGNEVLAILPKELNGLKADPSSDKVMNAAVMMGGTNIQREYTAEEKRVSINITLNSPLVATLGMYLSNPMYAQSMGSDQKVISIGSRRAIFKHDKESKNGELQVVFGQNLITITADGIINSEAEMTALAQKIDFAKIDSIIGN